MSAVCIHTVARWVEEGDVSDMIPRFIRDLHSVVGIMIPIDFSLFIYGGFESISLLTC